MNESGKKYEHSFIIALLSSDQQKVGDLMHNVDVDSLLTAVKNHKIDAAIGKQAYLLPESEIKTKLLEAYQKNKFFQLQLTQELCAIHSAFDGIDFLTLKGPVLSQFLHGDPAERTSWDLDILIDLNDLNKCTEILTSRGYDLITYFNTEKQKQALIKYHHHFEFYDKSTGFLIELHWKLTDMKGMNITLCDLIPQTSYISIANHNFRILNLEHQFEYLAIHGTFHLFRRLQWLCDLHTLVDRLTNEQLDQISSHCKKNNSHVFFLVTFSLLNRVFGSRLNRSLQSEIDTNSSVQKLTELSLREIYLSTFGIKRKSWEIMLRNHKTQYYTSGFLVLLKSIFARGVRPKTWRFFAFPDSVFFLNYVFSRIVWLAGKIKGKL